MGEWESGTGEVAESGRVTRRIAESQPNVHPAEMKEGSKHLSGTSLSQLLPLLRPAATCCDTLTTVTTPPQTRQPGSGARRSPETAERVAHWEHWEAD